MNGAVLVFLAALASDVGVGERVRVTTSSGKLTGRVQTIENDALQIRLDDGFIPRSIPFSEITKLERSSGPRGRCGGAWSKAKWGALIGAVPGAISLALQHDQVGEDGSSVGEAAALGAWSGALFGGLIGAVMGGRNPGEGWEQVTPAFQLGTSSGDSGFSLSVTIAFVR